MKSDLSINWLRAMTRMSLAATACLSALTALGYNYTTGDLELGFRQPGSTYELSVNLGRATNYDHIAAGTTLQITNYTGTIISNTFSDFGSVQWSAFGTSVDLGNPNIVPYTLWTTRGRATLGTQSTPWKCRDSFDQPAPAQQMESVGLSSSNWASSRAIDGTTHTATAVRMPESVTTLGYGYHWFVGSVGDWSGTFQGNVEQTTPSDFVSTQETVQADLYKMVPTDTVGVDGTYLGYFQFSWDGTMTFTAAGSSAPPASPQLSVTRVSANVYTISFSAEGNNAIYSLLATNASPGLNYPRSTWPVVRGPVTNSTAGILSFQVTNAASSQIYAVKAWR
jgi:hypothetical protein